MKITELLTIPELQGMQLIAGESGIEREVASVNMMDAPDIVHYLKEKEFLVTTAYHLKDQPSRLLQLVKMMNDQGCAGLGIKTKRFIEEIPEDVIQLANDLNFPLIELPLHLSLGQIVNHTFHTILDKRAKELTLALETHKQFTHIIMQGKGIPALLHSLSQLINRPVQLVNQYFKLIFQSSNVAPLLLEPVALPSPPILPESFSILVDQQTYTLFRVQISERKTGFLVLAGEIDQTDRVSLLTIEQAVNVISFSLIKENALKQQERNVRNVFLMNFLEGGITSNDEILGRAAEFALKKDQTYICALGKMDSDDLHQSYLESHEKTEDLFDFLDNEMTSITEPNIHFFKKGETCLLLFEIGEGQSRPTDFVKSRLKHIQLTVSKYFSESLSFGVSNSCQNFLQVKQAYQEAKDALAHGTLSKQKGAIHTYHTKDITALLRQIPQDDLKNYYMLALNGLMQTSKEEARTLLETLSVYLETHCQISETAKRLFVHRNTVVYRIEKCEEILGRSLKDAETTLQIRLALRIQKLLEDAQPN
ncbi:PucR family transcriptional regulator [Pullulanibacillus sp. KACC 23026]|uniref:PucR family transcriptional regulator n=1 Tax=Pullulanibacillus sp. KACC 23026 TaxID=3028315 RepID=UPI0023B14042|nr:PucR family transcriptional regulator [Pullulanibacillus sp. KACC 23026]WEG13486.1 PucR family transcriptional regulator [Pullulanibacillus sp. KACC 23026]